MTQELKIRITDMQTIEDKIKTLGANFIEETAFTDTYFNQPTGEVFKVSDTDSGFFLVQFKKTPEGKFDQVKNDAIEHADQVIAEMTNEYGIKSTLKGKRRTFTLDNFRITLNSIDDRGTFLIVTGENPTEDFIITKLGIQNPEYIQVSFDELPIVSPMTPTQ